MNDLPVEFAAEASSFSSDLLSALEPTNRDLDLKGQMFHCSMDDVGNCNLDGVRAFVGYAASKEAWDRFNFRWQNELKEANIDFLHTAHFLNDWKGRLIGGPKTEEDDYLILKPFIRIVREELLAAGGFGVIVVTECAGYNSLTKKEKQWVRPPSRHSFEILLGLVCNQLSPKLSKANPIAFQVDESDAPDEASRLLTSYSWLKKRSSWFNSCLGALCFVDDKLHYASQAADMLGNLALKGWRKQKEEGIWPMALRQAITRDEHTSPLARAYDEKLLRSISNGRKMLHDKIPQIRELDEAV